MTELNRRTLLAGSALTAAARHCRLSHVPSSAAAPATGKQSAGLLSLQARQLRSSPPSMTAPGSGDGRQVRANASRSPDVQKALSDAFLPTDNVQTPFTTLIVNTGSRLIALDTGTGGQLTGGMAPRSGTFTANLAAAGIDPKSVDAIYISHFHPDHINGIKTKDNDLVLPECLDQRAGAGMGVLDGRRQYEQGAGSRAGLVQELRAASSAISPPRCSVSSPARKSKPASPRSPRSVIRPATPSLRSRPATSRCCSLPTPPTMRVAVRAQSGMAVPFDSDGTWRWRRARRCSTAPPPTRCWCTAITGRSRPPATSSRPRRATIWCRPLAAVALILHRLRAGAAADSSCRSRVNPRSVRRPS